MCGAPGLHYTCRPANFSAAVCHVTGVQITHTRHAHLGNRTVFTKTIRQPDSLNIYSIKYMQYNDDHGTVTHYLLSKALLPQPLAQSPEGKLLLHATAPTSYLENLRTTYPSCLCIWI